MNKIIQNQVAEATLRPDVAARTLARYAVPAGTVFTVETPEWEPDQGTTLTVKHTYAALRDLDAADLVALSMSGADLIANGSVRAEPRHVHISVQDVEDLVYLLDTSHNDAERDPSTPS